MDQHHKPHWSRHLLTKKVEVLQEEVPARIVVMHTSKRLISEMLGTFFLVLYQAGLGSTVSRTSGALSYGSQAACGGAGLAALIYAFGKISGAHLNPAVTFAFWIRRDMRFGLASLYILFQFAGGFAAAGILAALWGRSNPFGIGANIPFGLNYGQAFLLELMVTLVLVLVAVGTAERGTFVGAQIAIAVGASSAAGCALGAPYGGGSLNPARSLPTAAIQVDAIKYVWIYVGATMASSIVAAVILYLITDQMSYDRKTCGVTGVDEIEFEEVPLETPYQHQYVQYKSQFPREFSNSYQHIHSSQAPGEQISPGASGINIIPNPYQRMGINTNEI